MSQILHDLIEDARRRADEVSPPSGIPIGGAGSSRSFLARIAGHSLISGHDARWFYTCQPVQLTASSGYTDTGAAAVTAINLLELSHVAEPDAGTAWYVWGVDAHGSAYPDAFAPRPVGGGGTDGTHKIDVVVEVTPRTASDGSTVYTFEAMGSHDGDCS